MVDDYPGEMGLGKREEEQGRSGFCVALASTTAHLRIFLIYCLCFFFLVFNLGID